MKAVLPHTARQFARAIIMPNLRPPVRTVNDALAYRERILDAIPIGSDFEPLMTLYLTDNTSPGEIASAVQSGFVKAVKYYPAGATTNSDSGVTNLRKCDDVFAAMQEAGLPLLMHGEVTGDDIDVFDREKIFVEQHLIPLTQRFPKLRIVMNTSPPPMPPSSCWPLLTMWPRPLRRNIFCIAATRFSKVACDRIYTACRY